MILSINSWLGSMTVLEQVYWIIALAASTFFVVQLIITFVAGDLDVEVSGDTDFDIDHDAGIPFQFFTLKNLIAFFAVFGWTGVACLDAKYSTGLTIFISTIAGVIMMVIMTALFYFISKMTDSGTMNIRNAIGKIGTAYLPIKARRGNVGKVQIKIQGSLRELQALTDEEEDIPTGSVVSVKDVLDGNILLIEKSK